MLVVHELARILLDMDALDPDNLVFRDAGLFIGLNQQFPLAHQRVIELADLVSLRQIGIEVVLAVEPAPCIDLRLDRHAGAHRLADAFAVGHGQHAGHGRIDEADLRIGLCPEGSRRTGKQLGLAGHLRMDFEADHDLPFAGCALNTIIAHASA